MEGREMRNKQQTFIPEFASTTTNKKVITQPSLTQEQQRQEQQEQHDTKEHHQQQQQQQNKYTLIVHTLFSVDSTKPIEAHLVHQAVQKSWRSVLVNAEFSGRRVVIMLLDVFASVCASSNTHHPQEFVDV